MNKILKVNFSFTSDRENRDDLEFKKDNIFDNVIEINDVEQMKDYKNLNTFNYIYFNNPLVDIRDNQVLLIIEKMKNQDVDYANFTLKQINSIGIDDLYIPNLNDLLLNSIVKLTKDNEKNLLELFFASKINKEPKIFIELNKKRNSRGFWNVQPFKIDVLDPGEIKRLLQAFIYLCEIYETDKLIKLFGTEERLIIEINKLVDNSVFENKLVGDMQTKVLNKIENIVHGFNLNSHIPNTLFYNLVKKSYYSEAIKALSLYRSYYYWSNVESKVIAERANDPQLKTSNIDIRKTEMWKKTQKFRDFRITLKNKKKSIEKVILKQKSKLLKKNINKPIWLISERRDTASDNSYYLYKYLRTEQNEIEAFYLIDKNAHTAIEKLKSLGENNIVYFGTERHQLLLLAADKLITSFTIEETMLPFNPKKYKEIYKKELREKDIISIQHGMIIHNISPYLSKKNYEVDYITANNELEKKIIMDTLGFKDKEVLITGMARQDNLINKSKFSRNILFMPTWQRALQHVKPAQFLESEYYKQIIGLITNPGLLKFLKENNLKIKVLMHPQFEKFASLLINNNEMVEFLSLKEVEVPDLIAECRLLITDFSSVCVDFLFQKKNVIFFQYNKYASHHVPSEEIKYSDIGKVVSNIDDLLLILEKIKNNNYELLKDYIQSREKLFVIKKDIRKHIFNTIKSL